MAHLPASQKTPIGAALQLVLVQSLTFNVQRIQMNPTIFFVRIITTGLKSSLPNHKIEAKQF